MCTESGVEPTSIGSSSESWGGVIRTRSKPQCPLESSDRNYSKHKPKSGQAFFAWPMQIGQQKAMTRFVVRARNPRRYSKQSPHPLASLVQLRLRISNGACQGCGDLVVSVPEHIV